MQQDIFCKLYDRLECVCGYSALLQDFTFVPWERLPEPGGRTALTGYYFCACQLHLDLSSGAAKPIAYRQGGDDADPRIIISDPIRVKIVEKLSSH